tara:strand:- start:1327 stop:2439 length:1113 start_codon:yes stop_codon:yes gene_type:complete
MAPNTDITDESSQSPQLNPAHSLIYFLLVTVLYGLLMIYGIQGVDNKSTTALQIIDASRSNGMYTLVYILLILGGMFFTNLQIHRGLCNNGNDIKYFDVFISTLMPWLIVFSLLYFILEFFDGWVKPFSNTIGYSIVNMLGLKSKLNKILSDGPTTVGIKVDHGIATVIREINTNKTMFINELDHKLTYTEDGQDIGFQAFMENMKKSALLKHDIISGEINKNKDIIELFKLVNIKFMIGKLVWYLLAGSLVASISYNYIINIKCETSLRKAAQDYDALYDAPSNDIIEGKRWRKHTGSPPTRSNDLEDLEGVNAAMLRDTLITNEKGKGYSEILEPSERGIIGIAPPLITLTKRHYIKTSGDTYYVPVF